MSQLKELNRYLINKFRNQDEKTKIVAKNIFWSALIKVVNIVTILLSVPLLLAYLNPTEYGIWLTLSAFLGWFGVFDLGVGNGLRNKLTEALTLNRLDDARIYISTAYAILSAIFAVIFILFCIFGYFVKWSYVFNSTPTLESQLFRATLILFGSLCSQFVLKLISTILISNHKLAWSEALNTFIQIIILFAIWNISNFHTDFHILNISIIYALIPFILLGFSNFIFFKKKFKILKPSLSYVRLSSFKEIGKLGFSFFFIQLAAVVIYATDNMLISHLFSPKEVTVYNIAFKYFSVITMVFGLVIGPFWSMTTKAYKIKDIKWIEKSLKKLILFWFGLILLGFIFFYFSEVAYFYWTKNTVDIPLKVSLTCLIYVLVMAFGNIFANILNALSKIKLQLYVSFILMFLNIPIAIILCKYYNLGVIGVPLSGIICMIIANIILYFQTYNVLRSNM